MKVIVTLELDVDPEEWDASYGTGEGKRAITADVKAYVKNHLQQSSAAEDGLIREVTTR